MKPVLFAVSAEGLVNPTVTSTVLTIIALMHIGIAPAVSKLISPIGVYPSGAVTGTLKSADFQAPKFIVPLVLFILSKLCESPFCGVIYKAKLSKPYKPRRNCFVPVCEFFHCFLGRYML